MDQEREIVGPLDLRLGPPLDTAELRHIEQKLHLDHRKWDTQVGDVRVLLEQPLILSRSGWDLLCRSAERLAAETLDLESVILNTPHLRPLLAVPNVIWDAMAPRKSYLDERVQRARSMRFDFHPTLSGWRISEVNSDVPGGWGEATILPRLFQPFYKSLECPPSPLCAWGEAIESLAQNGHVALLHAPHTLRMSKSSELFFKS